MTNRPRRRASTTQPAASPSRARPPLAWTHVFEGEYDDDGVYFYQAFNDAIADCAVEHQALGGASLQPDAHDVDQAVVCVGALPVGVRAKHSQERVLKLKLPHAAVAALLSRCACKVGGGGAKGRVQWDPARDLETTARAAARAPSRGGCATRARDPDRPLARALGDLRGEHHRGARRHRARASRRRRPQSEGRQGGGGRAPWRAAARAAVPAAPPAGGARAARHARRRHGSPGRGAADGARGGSRPRAPAARSTSRWPRPARGRGAEGSSARRRRRRAGRGSSMRGAY